MHAVVVRVAINNVEAAREVLTNQVVPGVSAAPGFQTGHWTWGADQSDGVSLVVFDSEENARAAADRVSQMITEDVSLQSVEVREVIASA